MLYSNGNLLTKVVSNLSIKIRGEEYLFVEDLVRILRVTPETLRLWFKFKKLKGRKLAGKWMISNTNLKLFLDGSEA